MKYKITDPTCDPGGAATEVGLGALSRAGTTPVSEGHVGRVLAVLLNVEGRCYIVYPIYQLLCTNFNGHSHRTD